MADKIIIIGSGPVGIGAALSIGKDCTVLEAGNVAGGYSRSIVIDGAFFDLGGHSFHTPHQEVRDLVYSSLEMYEQKRDARCFAFEELIPYPFQKNFHHLTHSEIIQQCLDGLNNTNIENDATNFEDFIVNKFGQGIAKHFMLPYNQKLWGKNLRNMSTNWTKERIVSTQKNSEKFSTTSGIRKPLQQDTIVAYPAQGGFGEIFKALAKKIYDLRLNQKVVKIDDKSKLIYLENGESIKWHKIVSTMPINLLMNLIEDIPEYLMAKISHLNYVSLKLGLVVVNHPVDTEIQRIYCAQEDIAGHKIAINHNSSDFLRKLPHQSIMVEMSTGSETVSKTHNAEKWIIESLQKMGVIKNPEVVTKMEIRSIKYAYPIPTHDKDIIIEEIQQWLESRGIFSIGRFGQWAYINSDEAIYRGIVLGRKLSSV